MKRSLIFGLIAVLSAGLLLVACSDGSDSTGSSTVINGRLVDKEVASEEDLYAALLNPDYQVIGVTGIEFDYVGANSNLTLVTEIPAGKTVVLYTPLVIGAATLEVKGGLIVEGTGVLTATVANNHRVRVTDGYIEVNNGTIDVDSVVAIHGATIEIQILGTSKARFNGGTLSISNRLALLEDVKTAFSWVPKGTVELTTGVAEKVKPSDLVAAIPAVTAVRRLYIADVPYVGGGDTVEELEIPAGLYFRTEDPLPNLKTLTVKGGLDAKEATLASLETLNVEGEGGLEAAKAMYTKLTDLTVSSFFEPATDLSGLKTLTVKAGGEFRASTVNGASGTDGLTLTVEKEGSVFGKASITTINRLVKGDIQGALTSVLFTGTSANPTDTPLTVAAGGTVNGITFPSETKITELGSVDTVTAGALTVPAGAVLVIPGTSPGPAKTLTIVAGSTLTYEGVVTIVPGGNLILATGTGSSVAKLAGTGKITAGFTTISGAWDTVGTAAGTVTFLSGDAGATITADGTGATGLKAGAGAIITQNAGENNNLTLGAGTDIDLGGTDAEVGVILLKNDTTANNATNNALLTLTNATTSTIKTGNAAGAGGTTAQKLATNGVSAAASDAFEAFGITNLAGDGTKAKVTSTALAASGSTGPAGKLVVLSGDGTVTGGGAVTTSPDGRISALTVTNATP